MGSMDTANEDLAPGELKQYRDALGMTQVQIAERFGVDRSTWTRWENGSLQTHHPRMLKAALNWLIVESQLTEVIEEALTEEAS